MVVVFSPIFVADTKILFRYDFVAPLNKQKEAAVCNILRKTPVLESLFDKVAGFCP